MDENTGTINKYSEADAKEELARIAEDGQITGQDIDWTGDGTDQNGQHEEETEIRKRTRMMRESRKSR